MSNNKDQLSIDYDLEPYHRRWSGGTMHTYKNKIGGAFGATKREMQRAMEARNHAAKLARKKQNAKR